MRFHLLPLLFILLISHFPFSISNSSIAYAIEVGGHLTEDTTWNPENNPYLVIENLYVDSGVTLTILPGTEIKISGAPLTSSQDYDEYFWYQNGTNEAKMFWVDGRIIAEGSQQDSIIFTRMQDDPDYYWGCIYMTEQSELNIFKHCILEYSGSIGIYVSRIAKGVLSIYNGKGIINNNDISNNSAGIILRYVTREMEIKNNSFYNDNLNNYVLNLWQELITLGEPEEGLHPSLIANNYFDISIDAIYATSSHFINNEVQNAIDNGIYLQGETGTSYYFGNIFTNCNVGIGGGSGPIYIKNNRFIGGNNGIDIDQAYIEISDNYFEGCDLDTGYDSDGEIFNNELDNGEVFIGIDMEFYNNLVINYSGSNATFSAYDVHNLGNLFYNNENTFSNNNDNFHTNCVILQSNDLFWWPTPNGTDTFRNCIIDFELEYPLIDGGGNIIVDSLQAQSIFEDIQNGDFHLAPGSIAIDAGFDTLGYYYPFDLDYNTRVWDGDNNGTAIIDIGPYEFGAPSLGGIEGVTYNPTTNEPVDYVLLRINNQPGEFTFTDSIGNFEYNLPAGVYDVYAERVFYEDVIEYQIEVIDGEFTQIAIPMFETVVVEENELIQIYNNFNLINYPNPFNPSTIISFSIHNDSNVELSIFNIKGQKIATLIKEHIQKGKHTAIWSGVDESNKPVSSGIYLYKIKVGNQESVNRMLLLK